MVVSVPESLRRVLALPPLVTKPLGLGRVDGIPAEVLIPEQTGIYEPSSQDQAWGGSTIPEIPVAGQVWRQPSIWVSTRGPTQPSRVPMSQTRSGGQEEGLRCRLEQHEVAEAPDSLTRPPEATE